MRRTDTPSRRCILTVMCTLACVLGADLRAVAGRLWIAQPLIVHEWGVKVYNWWTGVAEQEPIPDFIYTDKRPGKPVALPAQRVRDLPPDSGMRRKPVLYFYPQSRYSQQGPVSVGVEVRFAQGHANAWWPQVNVYRTPAQVARAQPFGWAAWRKERALEQRGARRTGLPPDDERFELVWQNLQLTKELPKGAKLTESSLHDDQWVRDARAVDAWYISNGSETEKFLFYEGTTRQPPCIAFVPANAFALGRSQDRRVYLVNVADYPIYDVFFVYRITRRQRLWTQYVPVLPPVPDLRARKSALASDARADTPPPIPDRPVRAAPDEYARMYGHNTRQVMAIELASFDEPSGRRRMRGDEFQVRTKDRLIEVLTSGTHFTRREYHGFRDPAVPQPPTKMHMLYPKEAVALEKIWHKDFFGYEGIVVLYREPPERLDEVMPLHIYTDKNFYVKLSRCGLVLNQIPRGVSPGAVAAAVQGYVRDDEPARLAKHLKVCRDNRFLTLGLARYALRQEPGLDRKKLQELIRRFTLEPDKATKRRLREPWQEALSKGKGRWPGSDAPIKRIAPASSLILRATAKGGIHIKRRSSLLMSTAMDLGGGEMLEGGGEVEFIHCWQKFNVLEVLSGGGQAGETVLEYGFCANSNAFPGPENQMPVPDGADAIVFLKGKGKMLKAIPYSEKSRRATLAAIKADQQETGRE